MITVKHISDTEAEISSIKEAMEARWPAGVYENRNDWSCLEQAEIVAKKLTKHYLFKSFMATDEGTGCSPRYDVIEAPRVGDEVSKSFNGDYYPCGNIVAISQTKKKITTSTGESFYRRKDTGKWLSGPFALIKGVESRLSPEF